MPVSFTVDVRTLPIEHEVAQALVDRFAATLFDDKSIAGPAISYDAGVGALEVRASVDAARTDEAIAAVTKALERALRAAHIVARQGRIAAWPDVVNVDDPEELVNGGEVARRLGISRERIRQLVTEQPRRFPAPVAETDRDRIFRWGDVVEWQIHAPKRKTGRPRKQTAELLTVPTRAMLRRRAKKSA